MIPLVKLMKEAEEACKFRGHDLKQRAVYHGEGRSLANSECKVCGAWVQCNTHPLPNEIDIGGPAVAIGCNEQERRKQ